MPSLIILIPLLGLIVLNLPIGNFLRRGAFWFAIAIFSAQVLLAVFHHSLAWTGKLPPVDALFKVGFTIDHLTFIMFICIGLVSFSSLLVARHAMGDEGELFKFINLLIIASVGMSGIVMVKDIFSLYIFLEITSIASFILIAFKKDVYGLEGAFKYLVLSAVATILMLTSIALFILVSGDTSFSTISASLQSGNRVIVMLGIGIFICGLFIKGGVVPFHGWLPDAYMAAPAPVSILLAGIITKAAGIYTLIRITSSVFGFIEPVKAILMLAGTVSILFGAFAALGQNDFKRMLAYSSISQIGYIVLGVGTGTALGLAGAVFHLFNHSVFKSLLFVNASAVEKELKTNDMNRMGGLSYRMPITSATSMVGFLSTCGIPPLSGFWSKLLILIALWQAGHFAYATIAVLASVLTLAYFLMMQRKVFFGKLALGLENVKERGAGIMFVSIALAFITIGAGIFFPVIYNNFLLPIKEILVK
jgi:multicomponent Na+:H+ antiporter subunit D